MQPIKYNGESTPGASPIIWGDCPWESIMANRVDGFAIEDDFVTFLDTARWTGTNATAGTFVQGDTVGGALVLDAGASTADQGAQVQMNSESFQPLAGTRIWYEARLHVTNVTGAQLFVGLAQEDTTVFAAGANSTANHIGFEANALTQAGTVGTAGTLNFYGENAGTRNTAAADVGLDVKLLVASTYVKLGFVIDGITQAKVYVDGADTMDRIATANIPTGAAGILTPTFVCMAEGAQPVMTIDWVKCAQLQRV